MSKIFTFPSRNEARAILMAISFQNHDSSLNHFTKKVIQINKDNGIDRTTFIFTNAVSCITVKKLLTNKNTKHGNI